MGWNLAATLRRLGGTDEPGEIEFDDPLAFPAGVVAVGRGGAGETGALLREDGAYIGLLCLTDSAARSREDVVALAAALPPFGCQIVTVRWPVDADQAAARWRAAGRGQSARAALSLALAESYLPALAEGGWSDVRSLLTIERPDLESAQRDLTAIVATLPVPARPATLAEAKWLAGDWFAPHVAGLVTIGWSVTELAAAPPPDWARLLLECDSLQGLPTMVSLHLGQAGAPAPVSFELRRRVAFLDAEIEARRRAGRHAGLSEVAGAEDLLAERRELLATLAAASDGERPRPARLVIGCAVEPRHARALRSEVEPTLHQLGFIAGSLGPGRSRDTHLTCAPLGMVLVGRNLTLSSRGAALLAPLVAEPERGCCDAVNRRAVSVPLGLLGAGEAVHLPAGGALLVVGVDGSLAQPWALGEIAGGAGCTVIDTSGRWGAVAAAAGAERVLVAAGLGGLLGELGGEWLRTAAADGDALDRWVTSMAHLFADLCPALSDDDLGDLTGHLLALGEAEVAWGEPAQLPAVVARLRGIGSEAAVHLATLLTATGGLRPAAMGARDESAVAIFDATSEQGGQRLVPSAGSAAVAVRAALDHLARIGGRQRHQVVIIDDLAAVLAATAGPALVLDLVAQIRRSGAALWCVASSLATCPRPVLAALRDLLPATVILAETPEAVRSTAAALGLPAAAVVGAAAPGDALYIPRDATTALPLRLFPMHLPPYVLRAEQEPARRPAPRRSAWPQDA